MKLSMKRYNSENNDGKKSREKETKDIEEKGYSRFVTSSLKIEFRLYAYYHATRFPYSLFLSTYFPPSYLIGRSSGSLRVRTTGAGKMVRVIKQDP